MLFRNQIAVTMDRLPVVLTATACSVINSTLGLAQRLAFRAAIRRSDIRPAPIFVIGHWRSGTTLMHELLSLDPRHGYPTTYACFAPHHFLLTEPLLGAWFDKILPRHRPMDNVRLSADRPQEDEFALCNLGAVSPYWIMAFPRHMRRLGELFEFEGLNARERRAWERLFRYFVSAVALRGGKRVVLKSPAHTFRIAALLKVFPDAKFVHLVREPGATLVSTVHMWRRLFRAQSLQGPDCEELEDLVFEIYSRLHSRVEEARTLLDDSQLCDVRYEDLVAEPLAVLEHIYETLQFGEFEAVREAATAYLRGLRHYQPNQYEISHAFRRRVEARCEDIINRYNYQESRVAVTN
jgi:hypothetical protein